MRKWRNVHAVVLRMALVLAAATGVSLGSTAAWAAEIWAGQESEPGTGQPMSEPGGAGQPASEPGGTGQPTSEPDGAGQPASADPGWISLDGSWYWLQEEGTAYRGWKEVDGRWYYMGEDGIMVQGWKEIDGKWYYFHEDGAMNQGELILNNGVYQFGEDGALKSSGWLENTGGGPYEAGCYDEGAQALFDLLNEEKQSQYFDKYPERQDSYDSDMHSQYDRYAAFRTDMKLNEIAAHRLEAAAGKGYLSDGTIPGDGTLSDYLAQINYRRSASCLELYLRDCQDAQEAFEKIMAKTKRQFDSKEDRKYSLEYYRHLGMSHQGTDDDHSFLVILMR